MGKPSTRCKMLLFVYTPCGRAHRARHTAANVHSLDGYTCQGTPSLMDEPQMKPCTSLGGSSWHLSTPLDSSTARQSRQSRQSRQYTHFAILLSYLSKIHSWYLEQDLVAGFSLVKKSSKKTKIRPNGGGVNVRNCCIHSSITPFVWLSVGPN